MAELGVDIAKASSLLEQGQLVGIPTETVYGLGGNAFNDDAVLKIFKVKRRPSFDPLIVHATSLDQIKGFVKEVPKEAKELASRFWPGPLTILLKKKPIISDLVTSGLNTVAVRIPRHPLTTQLLESVDFPIAAPSANLFGYVSPTRASHVNEQLGDAIPYVLDGGDCSIGVESTIVSFEGEVPTVLRLGGQPIELIQEIVGEVKVNAHSSSKPSAPGMLKSHYAPGKPVVLEDVNEVLKKYPRSEVGALVFGDAYPELDEAKQIVLSDSWNLEEIAKNLFGALRELDQKSDIRVIVSGLVPDQGIGRAINDRLKRAAAK